MHVVWTYSGGLGVGLCPTHPEVSAGSVAGSGVAGEVASGGRKVAIFANLRKWAEKCKNDENDEIRAFCSDAIG